MAELELENVGKSFGAVEVIRNFNLSVEEGEFVVFVGPSGCGKSTLLRMIAGLEDITSGELRIGGRKCNNVEPRERGTAMVFQSYALYPHMTVAGNMGFGLKLSRTPKAEIRERVERVAKVLQMEHLLDRKPSELSGGQRQRVAIGRAIIRQPRVFLFDEPLSNLDAALRVDMRMELSKLHAELGATMIYVTHDQVEAMTMADKIVVLKDGEVQQVGSPLELYGNPANLFVAGFIGSPKMNFFDATVSSGRDGLDSPDLKAGPAIEAQLPPPGTEITVGIRPQAFALAEPGTEMLTGEVSLVERLGDQTITELHTPGGKRLMTVLPPEAPVAMGDRVGLTFDPSKVLLFDANGRRLA
ncbi:ABC transporter ATP-binding protein [Pelagovum pacificum]|uniref:ABC transporter ATP-binding protein n=1 Tax=Pelagovum pacificum TaxID=2588711 RepID=A0A5C5GLA5_9RHOB|nr:ABC transporter ATP-binding protein [Pelagovum pacificum]QQA42703.1 ABC transporter ATP-binding protein [Pelagovum pacificum]TNY34146.1 ABC transporter ATP-binding protein [Pelagovum pacificum]